ncbi:hypothetical protein Rhein_0914 [Rheinheimera sp. A13L]|uniref:hypothetical protein n=1 Tax=Rheinheimera sp. A13L TaxID=506534 RepID=UPI0002124D19|nr:hypothetical protein [Rheinheimera sp. A13L]EGM79056.1 hypothetical protein Rhein_0914 [Rheinheimera sp. A13L]
MDYISLFALLSMAADTTAELGQLAAVADASITESKTCYRQGAFSFGNCDLSSISDQAALSYPWIMVNLLFAVIFFNPRAKPGWKVLAFLVGMPGTLFIAAFMQLFGKKQQP